MSVVMWQNISGGTEKGVEKVGRGSGFYSMAYLIMKSFHEICDLYRTFFSGFGNYILTRLDS